MGKNSLAWNGETQAPYVSSGPEEDRGCSAGQVGEGEGWEEVKYARSTPWADARGYLAVPRGSGLFNQVHFGAGFTVPSGVC